MKYSCKKCDSQEFILQLNQYDIFEVDNDKIVLVNSEQTNEQLILYCRNCSEELKFDNHDVMTEYSFSSESSETPQEIYF